MSVAKPLTAANWLHYLAAHNFAVKCDVCGSSDFNIHNELRANSRIGTLAFKFPGADVVGANVLALVMVACSRCHKVQFFAREPIAHWCEQHPTS